MDTVSDAGSVGVCGNAGVVHDEGGDGLGVRLVLCRYRLGLRSPNQAVPSFVIDRLEAVGHACVCACVFVC